MDCRTSCRLDTSGAESWVEPIDLMHLAPCASAAHVFRRRLSQQCILPRDGTKNNMSMFSRNGYVSPFSRQCSEQIEINAFVYGCATDAECTQIERTDQSRDVTLHSSKFSGASSYQTQTPSSRQKCWQILDVVCSTRLQLSDERRRGRCDVPLSLTFFLMVLESTLDFVMLLSFKDLRSESQQKICRHK